MLFFSIIVLPFLSWLGGSLFGAYLGTGFCYIAICNVFCSFLLSSYLLYYILQYNVVGKLYVGKWVVAEYFNLDWCFYCDSVTVTMLVIVTFISFLVHLYSYEYMKFDPHLIRFMSYLSLFTLFMLVLVTADNFLQMFVGWEGVGLSSYLLINFWFTRIQANKAAIKAMLVNRTGDFFILLALFLIYSTCCALEYDTVFTLVPCLLSYDFCIFGYNISCCSLICLCLFLGAMGKSAQLGLHTWLPDAMEGPTPVSALIHAATMVTAGVFLLIRCSILFEFSPEILNFILFIGGLTTFFAATIGLFQNDLKKVIAYSTCSQLGYMMFACGVSSYDVALFHLSNHAFFKALLFLGAGSIIHAMANEQDIRKFGALKNILPFSYCVMFIGSFALMGFPFLSGFYSKDAILEIAFAKFTMFSHFCYFFGCLGAFCTAFYSTRLFCLVFLSQPNGNRNLFIGAHEGSWKITLPLFLLAIISMFGGFLSKEFFISNGTDFWNFAIFILPKNYYVLDIEFISYFFKILPLLLTFFGIFLAVFIYQTNYLNFFKIKQNIFYIKIYTFLLKKWYIDKFYNTYISQTLLYFGYRIFYINIDRGLLEYFGPFGIVNNINVLTKKFQIQQSGFVSQYLFYFFFFIFIFIALVGIYI